METGRYKSRMAQIVGKDLNTCSHDADARLMYDLCKKCFDLCTAKDEIYLFLECPLLYAFRESLLTTCPKFIKFDGRSVLQKLIAAIYMW